MLDDNLIKITQTIEIFKFRNFKQNPQNYTTRSNPPFTRKQILSSRKENAQEKKEEGGDETSRFLISYRSFCGQKRGSAVIR